MKATKVIDDLRRQLEQAKAQVKDLDGHNAELKARLANASGSEGEAFELSAQLKKDLTNSRGENFELRAQLADLSEQLRRARLETMDANAAVRPPFKITVPPLLQHTKTYRKRCTNENDVDSRKKTQGDACRPVGKVAQQVPR